SDEPHRRADPSKYSDVPGRDADVHARASSHAGAQREKGRDARDAGSRAFQWRFAGIAGSACCNAAQDRLAVEIAILKHAKSRADQSRPCRLLPEIPFSRIHTT